jgi:pyridoxal phosphate enzyme (YggS family)
MNEIPQRLAAVRARIRAAALACGRDPQAIGLLAVSKTRPVEDVRAALRAGQSAFGENYLQEALVKVQALADEPIEWHFIGRIQGNKAKEIALHFAWVHGLDSLRHAQLLSRHRAPEMPPLQVCLQVNLSGEQSKGGVMPQDLGDLARATGELPGIELRGLMTMPDPNSSVAEQRDVFAALRRLRAELYASGLQLDTLSMGMSADMELAIAEGSTMVRIGTDIFGPRG